MVHLHSPAESVAEREQIAAETRSLVESAGASVVGELTQTLQKAHASTLVGSGKLVELADRARACDAGLVVFGAELTGSQVRNIEAVCGIRTIDRTQLVLDIFANRATSFEGKAQVRLAQLSYLLPRLVGQRQNLSRPGGGIGTRGPGETKLETDRRRIRKEIARLRQTVRVQGKRREERRRRRENQGVYSIGVVGYTNAGKTTLVGGLAKRFGDRPLAGGQDRLFDTLDLTSRRITYAGRTFVATDTVGFIRHLPVQLVDAFRATLEEAVDADALVLVVDASSEHAEQELETVYDVLDRVLAAAIPVITVFNERTSQLGEGSYDRLNGEVQVFPRLLGDPRAVSVVRGSVIDEATLVEVLRAMDEVVGRRVSLQLDVPMERPDVLSFAQRMSLVDRLEGDERVVRIDVRVDERYAAELLPYVATDSRSPQEDTRV